MMYHYCNCLYCTTTSISKQFWDSAPLGLKVNVPVDDVIVVPAPAAKTQARWDVTNDMYLSKGGKDTTKRKIIALIKKSLLLQSHVQ